MKPIISLITIAMLASALSGCIIRTRNQARHSRACPPSQHWNGNHCVHNGRGRGPKVRDHRR